MEFKDRLADHVLTVVLDTEHIKIYDFKKPDTIYLYQRWILNGSTLIVLGDCYSSIYNWYGPSLTLKFLSTCDEGYFSSKCVADKDGSEQTVYCEDTAGEMLKSLACESIYEQGSDELEEIEEEVWVKMDLDDKFDLCKSTITSELGIDSWDMDTLFNFYRESDAFDFMMDGDNEFMFGCDPWEHSITRKTMTPMMHLTAIKVASEKYPELFV